MRKSASVQCRSCTPARKHIFDNAISPDMQSVLSRRRQHAISYVLAGGSMDRADRVQGIQLIARMFARSFSFSSSSYLFPSLATFSSPSLPFFHYYSFSLPPKKGEHFYGRNNFQFGRKPPYRPFAVAFARVHSRIGLQLGRNSQLPRRVRGESRFEYAAASRRGNEPIRTSNKTSFCFPAEHSRRIFPGGSFSFHSLRCRMLIQKIHSNNFISSWDLLHILLQTTYTESNIVPIWIRIALTEFAIVQ